MGVRSDISSSRSQGMSIADGALFVLCFVYSFWCVGERLVARDEGFYGYAAQLILEGKHPYLDFFYPQMPFLPYVYAIGGALFGPDWTVFRGVSAVCFAGVLYATYHLISRHSTRVLGMIGIVVLGTCHLSFAWFPTVQTYSLSLLFVLLGVIVLAREEQSLRSALITGLFFCFAIQTRLFFAPVMLIPLVSYSLHYDRWVLLKGFCLGICIGALPSIFLFYLAPESFLFSNLGYHLSRSSKTLTEELDHKWRIVEVLFSLGRPSQKFDGFQTPLIFGGLLFSSLFFWWLSRPIRLCFGIALILSAVSFLPNPVYVQYFVAIVPFAVIVCTLASFTVWSKQTKPAAFAMLVMGSGVLGVYLWHVPGDIERYFVTGKGVIGIGGPEQAKDWNITRVKEVVAAIERYSKESDEILALWPGYLIGANRRSVEGAENHFGLRAAKTLSLVDQERFHVVGIEQITQQITKKEIPVVVGHKRSFRSGFKRVLTQAGYQKVKQIGAVELYRVNTGPKQRSAEEASKKNS